MLDPASTRLGPLPSQLYHVESCILQNAKICPWWWYARAFGPPGGWCLGPPLGSSLRHCLSASCQLLYMAGCVHFPLMKVCLGLHRTLRLWLWLSNLSYISSPVHNSMSAFLHDKDFLVHSVLSEVWALAIPGLWSAFFRAAKCRRIHVSPRNAMQILVPLRFFLACCPCRTIFYLHWHTRIYGYVKLLFYNSAKFHLIWN